MTGVSRAVTGVLVLACVPAVSVITQGIGVDPAVPVVLGHLTVRSFPCVIVLPTPHAWVRSMVEMGRAHRFLSGRPCGRDTLLIPLGGISLKRA
ncbi:hypothetical protein ACS0VI_29565 [Streptomyces sp. H28]